MKKTVFGRSSGTSGPASPQPRICFTHAPSHLAHLTGCIPQTVVLTPSWRRASLRNAAVTRARELGLLEG
jgi:hypothetical protein